ERFSVEYAPVEKELSRQVGDIRFASPISMRNEFSSIRIKHKVPGNNALAVAGMHQNQSFCFHIFCTPSVKIICALPSYISSRP
ncbi:MAG: hypothetical protein IIV09_09525, partial [Selenomonadaceae bacterium]|nr:hypothetical protein [Selenomonadaceae bacterium]